MTTKTETLIKEADAGERDDSSFNKAERTMPSRDEAEKLFRKVKNKLRHIDQWVEHSGVSYFAIFDEDGRQSSDNSVKKGRFIRILLPGTGKYDCRGCARERG